MSARAAGTGAPAGTVPVVRFTIGGRAARAPEPTPSGASGTRPYTVVYDGNCTVCGRLARTLERWDTPHCLEVIPSQAPGVHARFPWIPVSAYAEALQLVGPGGRTWQGAAAVEQILALLPRGWLVGWLFRLPFARTFADRFYRWFARNRYRLGCGAHCQYRPPAIDFGDAAR